MDNLIYLAKHLRKSRCTNHNYFCCFKDDEYTVGLSKVLQGSIQDVVPAYEEVTLLMDIFGDRRRDADADDSEIDQEKSQGCLRQCVGTVSPLFDFHG